MLEKCAAALRVNPADLYKVNVTALACDEDMQPGQMLATPVGRRVVVLSLTRQEYDVVRQFNAACRAEKGLPDRLCQLFVEGDRPNLLRDTGQHVAEPPQHCNRYYLCRNLDF